MDKVGIEPALLARFVLACQSPTLQDAAAELGQTPSALGIALRGLEERLGVHLFIRHGGGLTLRPSAFWLFRSACRLLYLEQHIAEAQTEQPLRGLGVELDLTFAIGRFSKALVRTTQHFIATEPEILVSWRFAGEDEPLEALNAPAAGQAPSAIADLRIAYGVPGQRLPAGAVRLYDDPWIVVGATGHDLDADGESGALFYVNMRPALTDAIVQHAARSGWSEQLRPIDAEPAELGEILALSRHRRLVMPASLLASRMGLVRHDHVPLSPPLVSPLLGVPSLGAPPQARQFLADLRDAFAEERKIAFAPKLTARQIHYFNLAVRTGGISAAARAANVGQSSVSGNLGRMEAALGRPLFRRHDEGVTLSLQGAAIRPLVAGLEQRQDWIARKAHDLAAHAEARVAIGALPSSGHDSALTEKIARVVARIHMRHPDWHLQIVESSNSVLHDRVRAGELNLAIVGVVSPQVARIPLGPSEQLCLVCHPSIGIAGREEVGLEEVCAMPLVLGPRHLGIHRNFAEVARSHGVKLQPAVEVGSLPLAIAMVKQAPLCTILPASSVQQDIHNRSLTVVPINYEELTGALWVIFSAERELSEAERSIIQEFVATFRAGASDEPRVPAADSSPEEHVRPRRRRSASSSRASGPKPA